MTLKIDKLYNAMKKRGFHETLLALKENGKIKQKEFTRIIDEEYSYYNAVLRVRDLLVKTGLIHYTLGDRGCDKYIELSEIGEKIADKLIEANDLMIEGEKKI